MNYVAAFPFALVFLSAFLDLSNAVDRRKILCVAYFLGSSFLIGLRSIFTAGIDTQIVYLPIFEHLINEPFISVCSHYLLRDPLFYIYTKLFTMVSIDFHLYLFVIAVFVSASISTFVCKYSSYPILSFATFMLLQYFGFEFQMIKHSIAFSILLFSYQFILTRKPIQFLAVLLISALFHISALVFLLAYFAPRVKVQSIHVVVLLFAAIGIILFRHQILSLFELVFQGERFRMYFEKSYSGELSLTPFFISCLVLALSYFVTSKSCRNTKEFTILFNLAYIATLILLGVTLLGESVRVSMFFGVGTILLLPYAIKNSVLEHKGLAIYFLTTVFILYFVFFGINNAGLDNYVLYWQEAG